MKLILINLRRGTKTVSTIRSSDIPSPTTTKGTRKVRILLGLGSLPGLSEHHCYKFVDVGFYVCLSIDKTLCYFTRGIDVQ